MALIKSIFGSLSIMFLIIGCKTITKLQVESPTIENPKSLILSNLKCLNMAEKLVGMGTKNDEILLLVFHLNDKKEALLITGTDILIFEKEDSIGQSLDITIPLDRKLNPSEFLFLLIEMDTERTKTELSHLAQNLLNQRVEPAMLKEKLREDDLLGIKTLSTIKTSKNGQLKFLGMHLFDKYHYEISYEFT